MKMNGVKKNKIKKKKKVFLFWRKFGQNCCWCCCRYWMLSVMMMVMVLGKTLMIKYNEVSNELVWIGLQVFYWIVQKKTMKMRMKKKIWNVWNKFSEIGWRFFLVYHSASRDFFSYPVKKNIIADITIRISGIVGQNLMGNGEKKDILGPYTHTHSHPNWIYVNLNKRDHIYSGLSRHFIKYGIGIYFLGGIRFIIIWIFFSLVIPFQKIYPLW